MCNKFHYTSSLGIVYNVKHLFVYLTRLLTHFKLFFQNGHLRDTYGKSGAGKIPDDEKLTPLEVLSLNFLGVEPISGKMLLYVF